MYVVTVIIEQVLALPDADKCLIFSQWDDMLALIGRALAENGVAFRRLQGRATLDAALHGFRHDASVRALLLPLKSGANGIVTLQQGPPTLYSSRLVMHPPRLFRMSLPRSSPCCVRLRSTAFEPSGVDRR